MRLIKSAKKLLYLNLSFLGIIKSKEKKHPELNGTWPAGNLDLIKIGKNVSFGGNVLLHADAPIEIGDNSMIAFQTTFYTSTHDYNDHPMWLKKINKPIKVGKHVWIGTGAIILPGVIIEDFAVIAAGSVVAANVPEGAIVAGNPARILKYRDKKIYTSVPKITQWKEGQVLTEDYLSEYCKEK
jgi:acetyltransferase-like isoleucine patch superfamily enzyme